MSSNKDPEFRTNGWTQYEKLVLSELERLSGNVKVLDKKVGDLRVDVASLKVKSGIWGAIAGVAAFVIAFVIEKFKLS